MCVCVCVCVCARVCMRHIVKFIISVLYDFIHMKLYISAFCFGLDFIYGIFDFIYTGSYVILLPRTVAVLRFAAAKLVTRNGLCLLL